MSSFIVQKNVSRKKSFSFIVNNIKYVFLTKIHFQWTPISSCHFDVEAVKLTQ